MFAFGLRRTSQQVATLAHTAGLQPARHILLIQTLYRLSGATDESRTRDVSLATRSFTTKLLRHIKWG